MWRRLPARLWKHLTARSTYAAASQARHSPEDLKGLVDGIYAIAATLLVLDLRLPPHDEGQLGRALGQIPAAYCAFTLGFVLVLAGWFQIRRVLRLIEASDHYASCLVLVVSALWSVTPFTMSTLAEGVSSGGADAASAVRLVAGVLVLVMLCWAALLTYLTRRSLWIDGVGRQVHELWVPASQLVWALPAAAFLLSYAVWWAGLLPIAAYLLLCLAPVEMEPVPARPERR